MLSIEVHAKYAKVTQWPQVIGSCWQSLLKYYPVPPFKYIRIQLGASGIMVLSCIQDVSPGLVMPNFLTCFFEQVTPGTIGCM
jgi:hypothetical protein